MNLRLILSFNALAHSRVTIDFDKCVRLVGDARTSKTYNLFFFQKFFQFFLIGESPKVMPASFEHGNFLLRFNLTLSIVFQGIWFLKLKFIRGNL